MYQTGKVSIIVLSRGSGDALLSTLDSIMHQTYRNTEIFLVVDDSDEKILQEIRPYKNKIRFIVKQRGFSRGKILNDVLKLAKGKYFCILAAGDLWQTRSLDQKVNFLEKNNGAFAVCCDFEVFDKSGVVEDSFFKSKRLFSDEQEDNSFVINEPQKYILRSNLRLFSSVLVRNEAYLFYGPFEEKITGYSDFDLLLRISRKMNIGCINKILVSRFFDVNKVSYYLNDNQRIKIAYFEYLLDSFYKDEKPYLKQVKKTLRRSYSRWTNCLIKSKEGGQAREIALEYLLKYNLSFSMLWAFLRSFAALTIKNSDRYDFFKTERMRKDLVKLHFSA